MPVVGAASIDETEGVEILEFAARRAFACTLLYREATRWELE